MSNATAVRAIEGTQAPAAGAYVIDPTHTSAEFQVRHLGLSKVRGRFGSLSGELTVADDVAASQVEVSIDAASIDTRNEDRDAHLRSADFLDVDTFGTLAFRSHGVRHHGESWKVDGDLTIRDITRPVTLDVEFEGAENDPWGNSRIAFTAKTEIDRDEFGLTWNQVLEGGGLLVGKTIKIEIDVQAVAQV